MKKKLKKGIIILVLLALAALIVSRFLHRADRAEEETRPTVTVASPGRRDIINRTEAIGTVEPEQEVDVMPKMAGEITDVSFAAGDRVEAGQTLITIHSDALDSLRIQLDSARIAMNDAETALGRTQALFATGAVSQQQLEGAQSAAGSTRLAYQNAETQLKLQTEYTTVKAPISGVIETKNVSVHDQASPAMAICTISGDGGMSVSFGVTEQVMRQLNVGDTIQLEKNAALVNGTVTEVSGKVSPATGLYSCRASIGEVQPAEDGSIPGVNLGSGSRAKVQLISARAVQALTVPSAAVSYADAKPYVYLFSDGHAVKREIVTGIFDESFMEVRDGLQAEDQVIVSWSGEIYDSAEVLAE